jgi:hypothetical protein
MRLDFLRALTLDNLPILPAIGHTTFGIREGLMNAVGLDDSERDSRSKTMCKNLLNSAIRISSLVLPRIPYLRNFSNEVTYPLFTKINLYSACAKGIYTPILAVKGCLQGDHDTITKAKNLAIQAIFHLGFWGIDRYAGSMFEGRLMFPIILTYIVGGAVMDCLGKSKFIHDKFFSYNPVPQAAPVPVPVPHEDFEMQCDDLGGGAGLPVHVPTNIEHEDFEMQFGEEPFPPRHLDFADQVVDHSGAGPADGDAALPGAADVDEQGAAQEPEHTPTHGKGRGKGQREVDRLKVDQKLPPQSVRKLRRQR